MPVLPLAAAVLVLFLGLAWAFRAYPVHGPQASAAALARAKRWPALLLAAMACGFLASFAVPHAGAAQLLRAGCEAAMVGALADWVAVAALFRRIPAVPESDLIARQKDAIGEELAHFVKDRFLDAESLVALIRRHDVAQVAGTWLAQEANARRVAALVLRVVSGALAFVGEQPVLNLLKKGARRYMETVDPAPAIGKLLQPFTWEGRHQQLLDFGLETLLHFLARPDTREMVADAIVQWLRTEHRWKQMVLPTEWLGDKGSEIVAERLGVFLDAIRHDRGHPLRARFDQQVADWVAQLQEDPGTREWWRSFMEELFSDELLTRFVSAQWSAFSDWVRQDIERPDSHLQRNVAAAAVWLGQELARDEELRAALNAQLAAAARRVAPEFGDYLSAHIRDTVRGWDGRELARQVEHALGPRLQKIRVNGTVMGFAIGVLLFFLERGANRWL